MDGTAPALRGGASIDGTAPALRGGALIDGTAPALRGGALVGSARESAAALTQRATDAMLRGNFQAADAAYQQAIAADPRHAPAFRGRGLLLERMDRPKDAARAFRQFLKLSPGGSGADKIRARLSALESQ
jgi:tetratricopeptide (TPR) repeat protein